ncbi:MAG TPA: DUF3102 domain-containing protein [Solirubrobacteraceae bacterium]|nr:DUF3102 domain-containing protein [Solirubrobacteraceae bacterium]
MTATATLDALAQRANTEHAAYEVTQRAALAHAIAAGQALIEAKAQLRHGEWERWVRAHCDFSPRTARVYRQIAKRQHSAGMDVGSIRDALAAVAEPRPPKPGQPSLRELGRRLERTIADRPGPSGPTVDALYAVALREDPDWAWSRAWRAMVDACGSGAPPGVRPSELQRLREALRVMEDVLGDSC